MSRDDLTLEYYENNADAFVDGTLHVEFSDMQDRFLTHIPEGGYILDFGCGSGRDTKAFLDKGYQVDAIDGSEKLCEIASRNTGIEVRQIFFAELDEMEKYDGIWACASILHLAKDELRDVVGKMVKAVKKAGFIYTSFRYGDFEGFLGDRYFTYLTEETAGRFFGDFPELKIVDEWVTTDVRPNKGDVKWLNLILQKTVTV